MALRTEEKMCVPLVGGGDNGRLQCSDDGQAVTREGERPGERGGEDKKDRVGWASG